MRGPLPYPDSLRGHPRNRKSSQSQVQPVHSVITHDRRRGPRQIFRIICIRRWGGWAGWQGLRRRLGELRRSGKEAQSLWLFASQVPTSQSSHRMPSTGRGNWGSAVSHLLCSDPPSTYTKGLLTPSMGPAPSPPPSPLDQGRSSHGHCFKSDLSLAGTIVKPSTGHP